MQITSLTPDASIDLQLHTIHSDGTWTPEALLDHLQRENFGLAAVTDHDRTDTIMALQQLADGKGVPLLAAVEMSAHWRGELVDVLCYGFDPGANALGPLAEDLLRQQQSNIRQTVAALAQQGRPLPESEIQTVIDKPAVQQPFALVALVQAHGYDQEKPAGRLLVESGLKMITTDIAVVVEATHRSDGVCLVAHPGRGDGYVRFDETLFDALRAEAPIDGFEVYYPAHSPAQIEQYQAYAARHNLLVSAGSDSHGPDRAPIRYRADQCVKLLERLGIEVG